MAEQDIKQNAGAPATRLFIKITRESLPRVADRYHFVYLERGQLEVDDSSIKWIDSEGCVVRLPVATISCLLLGPGVSITHEAVKAAAQSNCQICWVGEDSLLFYAAGFTPAADSRNLRRQTELATDPVKSLAVAKHMFKNRFPKADLTGKTREDLMGMEGVRVRDLYEQKAQEYGVGWKGRRYVPGKFEMGDMTNKILSAANAALYGILCSVIHSLGYSPRVGFVHSGSPLPFVYDLADLYKAELCVDLAFYETSRLAGEYNRYAVAEEFRRRVAEMDLLKRATDDIDDLLGEKNARRYSE